VTKDDKEIVSALRERLADRVGKDRYELWFGASTRLVYRSSTLIVEVASRFIQDWLRSNLRKDLETIVREVCPPGTALEFRVDESLAPNAGNDAAADSIADAAATDLANNSPANDSATSPPATTSNTEADVAKGTQSATPAKIAKPQVTNADAANPPARRRFQSLGTFVVGESNCLAHKSAQLAADRPGSYSPLFLHGTTGVGKTHLLEGIWSAFKKSHRHSTAIYLSAEQFTSYFLEALHGSGLPSFRRKYRDVELLIVDDVQFFAGKRATLVELLHTLDTLLRGGRQLVLAADRSPAALKVLGPELAARLEGGMICRIEPPEYQTRLGIVGHLAVQMNMQVTAEVQAYIAAQFTAHARELAGALKRLQASSLAHGRAISLGMAEEALADLIHHSGRVVRLPDIEKAVCEVFGLEGDCLQSGRKGKAVSHPRMLAMWLARKHTRAPLSEIGHYFGRRAHSTVISAQNKVETWMSKGAAVQLAERNWSLDEAIRRVEENLRAG